MAIPLLAMLGIGAATGMMKNQAKQAEFDRQKKIQAETTRMSPWTGMRAEAPVAYSSTGNILEGALGGLSMHQNMGKAAKQDEMMDAYMKSLQGSGQTPTFMPASSGWASYGSQPKYTLGNSWNF